MDLVGGCTWWEGAFGDRMYCVCLLVHFAGVYTYIYSCSPRTFTSVSVCHLGSQ